MHGGAGRRHQTEEDGDDGSNVEAGPDEHEHSPPNDSKWME